MAGFSGFCESLQTDIVTFSSNDDDKNALKEVLRKALHSITPPGEQLWDIMFYPHQYAVVRTAIELRIFHLLSIKQATAEELADKSGADKLLIVRLMRVLVGMHVVRETSVETYENTGVAEMLATNKSFEGGLKFMFDLPGQAIMKMPEALADFKWKSPTGDPTIFQKAFGPGTTVFSHLGSHSSSLVDFNNLMAGQRFNRLNWFDFFPVQDNLLKGAEESGSPLLVDIGGAQGFELQQFKNRFPSAQGQLILQDLPFVIDSITDLDEAIVRMKHDFFTPQPVKHARVYYFRSIFHDWDDSKCREILHNLRPAMKLGYSRLLINDWIIPESCAPLYPAMLDINMMALFSGMERTETQWRSLLESEGFGVVKFWSVPGNEGCIEAIPINVGP